MTLTRYEFDCPNNSALPDEYILIHENSLNSLGVILWRWNNDSEDYETLYDKKLFGYCPNCGSVHVLVNNGFDYDVAAGIVSNLQIPDCECD